MGIMKKIIDFLTFEEYEDDEYMEEGDNTKVLNIVSRKLKINILKLVSFDDIEKVTSKIKNNEGVIVDISSMPSEEKKRSIDFICGTLYALNGTLQQLKKDFFFFAPSDIEFILEKESEEDINLEDTL